MFKSYKFPDLPFCFLCDQNKSALLVTPSYFVPEERNYPLQEEVKIALCTICQKYQKITPISLKRKLYCDENERYNYFELAKRQSKLPQNNQYELNSYLAGNDCAP